MYVFILLFYLPSWVCEEFVLCDSAILRGSFVCEGTATKTNTRANIINEAATPEN